MSQEYSLLCLHNPKKPSQSCITMTAQALGCAAGNTKRSSSGHGFLLTDLGTQVV